MKSCQQTEYQTIWEHGKSVWKHTQQILNKDVDNFKLPDIFIQNYDIILDNIHKYEDIKLYNIYHDCGKPYCRIVDENCKVHFPNHAEVSKKTFNEISDNVIVGDLIGYDMALHIDTNEVIESYNWDIKTAFTLLITSYAELHSNAQMFGGIDSVSFKIKWKKLHQRCKYIINLYL